MMKVPVVSLTGSDIVESNPGKFRLGESELKERKDFVERTRKSVQVNLLFDFFEVCAACCYSPGVIMFFCLSRLNSYGHLSGLCFSGLRTFILEELLSVTRKHCLEGCGCDLAAEVFQTKTHKL